MFRQSTAATTAIVM